jgi:hypothetical protein
MKRAKTKKRLETWNERANREQAEWLRRPSLHLAVFEEWFEDNEFEKACAEGGVVIEERERFDLQQRTRKKEIDAQIARLAWDDAHLALFIGVAMEYRKEPSIENYLRVKQQFPEVEIQVARFGGLDPLFILERKFLEQGIDPALVAGAMDAVEPSIDALSLRLLQLLVQREKLPNGGPKTLRSAERPSPMRR